MVDGRFSSQLPGEGSAGTAKAPGHAGVKEYKVGVHEDPLDRVSDSLFSTILYSHWNSLDDQDPPRPWLRPSGRSERVELAPIFGAFVAQVPSGKPQGALPTCERFPDRPGPGT